ncbi:MICOS complex subunit MIC19 isoform X2 [Podarcis raffonei]|uniref:MICOS complex subunit MIC19 isoform X2 n=1 Tax=Podarcis raffonei TaxID=65483 RepID=UPI0023293AC3|nr:MICOS complex subunit MIC19 isoform X2 [Podarcis raffonei]
MGGGGSAPRRVTFEADENDNITVVKGVRLSENVIERMKDPSSASGRSQKSGSGGHGLVGGTSVNEEDLKKRIAEELALEQARRDAEAHKRLKQNQMHVRDEISKVLERERAASNEHLSRAILRERAATEDERLKAQLLAKQLEEKDRELKKHDAYYKEQLARLEERSSQFYKVTTEQYQKAVEEVDARFKAWLAEEDRSPFASSVHPSTPVPAAERGVLFESHPAAHLQGRWEREKEENLEGPNQDRRMRQLNQRGQDPNLIMLDITHRRAACETHLPVIAGRQGRNAPLTLGGGGIFHPNTAVFSADPAFAASPSLGLCWPPPAASLKELCFSFA